MEQSGGTMKRLFIATALASLFSTAAFSMPLFNQASSIAQPPTLTENVRVVCEENGVCYRVGPRPVARWVYGDGAFYGPYDGPHNYGAPGRHYKWSIFGPWYW
jgi:hypothetical protein